MEMPKSHQGMLRLEAKNSAALEPARFITLIPMISEIKKKAIIESQSMNWRVIKIRNVKLRQKASKMSTLVEFHILSHYGYSVLVFVSSSVNNLKLLNLIKYVNTLALERANTA